MSLRGALLITALVLLIDGILHYSLPETVAVQEGLPYFASKAAIVFIVMYIGLRFDMRNTLGTTAFAFGAAAAFSLFYLTYPSYSVRPAPFTLDMEAAWFGIHFGAALFAAAAYKRYDGTALLLGVLALGASVVYLLVRA
jgi:hypothetical protein